MKFKDHYLALSTEKRDALARQAGTTRGTLNQIVYAGKHIELGLADCLVALCPGLSLEDMPLTERAKQQALTRSGTAEARMV